MDKTTIEGVLSSVEEPTALTSATSETATAAETGSTSSAEVKPVKKVETKVRAKVESASKQVTASTKSETAKSDRSEKKLAADKSAAQVVPVHKVIQRRTATPLYHAANINTAFAMVSGKLVCTGKVVGAFEEVRTVIPGRGPVIGYVRTSHKQGDAR